MTYYFMTRTGEVLQGTLVHSYGAFEGGMRYIFEANGTQYRCIKNNDGYYVEYVA